MVATAVVLIILLTESQPSAVVQVAELSAFAK